jgi:hypothetical protein
MRAVARPKIERASRLVDNPERSFPTLSSFTLANIHDLVSHASRSLCLEVVQSLAFDVTHPSYQPLLILPTQLTNLCTKSNHRI